MAFRPWGLLEWMIVRCPNVNWSLFGCLGTEERSLAAWMDWSLVWAPVATFAGDDEAAWSTNPLEAEALVWRLRGIEKSSTNARAIEPSVKR